MDDQEPGPRPAAGVSAAAAAEALQRDLYVRNRPWMLRYASAFLNDRDAAEDVIELVFLKLFRSGIPLTRINERYLRTIVRNECRDMQRSEHRFARISESLVDGTDRAGRIDAMVDLERLISVLPPECAKVIRARMSGLKNSEIAVQLGLSPKAISERYQRATTLIRLQARSRTSQPTILRRNASNTKMVVAGPGARQIPPERSGS